MITLTNPIKVPNSIGGTTTINYDKLRIVNITSDPVSSTINAQVQILASTNPNQPVISGTLAIAAAGNSPLAVLQVPALTFYWPLVLSPSLMTTIQGWITTMQNNIEAGLVSAGGIAGTQTTGV